MRLSLALLILLILLGLAYILITGYSAREYYQETTQRLNAHVAEHMVEEVSPFVNGEVNEEALGSIMHSMMAVNPSIEVYLLDPTGHILSFVVLDKKVRLKNVDIKPVINFIKSKGEKYITGDDPRNPGQKAIFSATEVNENGKLLGYIYIVLASEQYENISGALFSSYFFKVSTLSFVITIVVAFSLGLILLALLTRNLRKIQNSVKRFETGDFNAKIPIENMGELSDLANTVNHMADTILSNIEDLREVDRLRRDLIANVSHDLRSPLSIIHGYIETLILKQETIKPEESEQYLKIILQSSDRLKGLVSDLFELSRLEARQVKLQKTPFYVNELLADTIRQYELMAKERHIKLETNLPQNLPMVLADLDLIGRVIQNLLDNALKFTPENGSIEVMANVVDKLVHIEISNSGEGINSEELPHIFDRYYKIDHNRNTLKGSGLGLAIVRKIIELHETDIKVSSEPGAYTRFNFTLPMTA